MSSPDLLLRRALARDTPGPLLVAFSGGLDSSALLHVLAQDSRQRELGLRAVHIHHGLQPQANAWASHCRDFCESLGIGLLVVRVQVDHHRGEGLEAAARHARYTALAQDLRDGEILVTAHHRDDQAETFLLRALRGSGPDGLAAMRSWRRFAHAWHWRPLLPIARSTLRDYARGQHLQWLEDPSNLDPQHDRNFLRQQLMPLLRERWPHAAAALARSAQLSAEAVDLLEQDDRNALAGCRTAAPDGLSVTALLHHPAPRRARLLRLWMAELALPPLPATGIARIESDLLPARADANPGFRWRNARILRWRDLLQAQAVSPAWPADWQTPWDGRRPLPLPDDGHLVVEGATALPMPVLVRARRGGERIVLPGRAHSHALKHLLQDLAIPPWQRPQLPLLFTAEGELLAVADRLYSSRLDHWLHAHGARLRWDCGPGGRPD